MAAEDEFTDLKRQLATAEASVREMRAANTALRESEQKYRALFEELGQGYGELELVRGPDGRVRDLRYIFVNPAHERLAGIKAEEAVGRTTLQLVPNFDPANFALYDEAMNSGSPVRVEYEVPELGRWYQVYIYPSSNDRVFVFYEDCTERKRNEQALRESEERQAFLLQLSDALRQEPAAEGKISVAARLLGQQLGASRILYAEYDWDRGLAHIFSGWFADGAQPFPTVMSLTDYDGEVLTDLRAGRTVRVDNVGLRADEPAFAAIAEVGVQALLSPPLIIDGTLKMNLSVHQHDPRHWTDADVSLVEEVADRLWAEIGRARTEAALRASEERFRQFADASSDVLWIRDAETLAATYVSAAASSVYGASPAKLIGDRPFWDSLVVPDERAAMTAQLEAVRRGEAAVLEFRVLRPSDQSFRWGRRTAFPLLGPRGEIEAVAGISSDVTEARLLAEHQGVLLAELQHRVRNIMAMIRSMALRTADGAADVEDYRSLLEGRLLALARVQVLLTREANAGGLLRDIIASEVSPQAHREDQFELNGPEIRLSPKAVEVLALAFHELATNALKYGALSAPDGRLRVSWSTFEKRDRLWVALDWTESGAPPRGPSKRRGFGSDLIEGRIPYELGGTSKLTLGPEGAHCRMEFPLKDGESILETDAPTQTTVFGGILDMTDAPDLTGRKVLVVEDDYYLAGDTAAALRGAGAEVLGPCPSEEATFDLLASQTPTHAVLDLNLGGGGPRFEIAHLLRQRGVPIIFMTGYDPDQIPAELEAVPRLQKPVAFRSIVEAISQL